MTPIRAIVRTGAAWFLPLLFALSCLFATRSTFRGGYPAGDIAQSSVGLYVAAPLTAAFMALQYRGFAHFISPLRLTRSAVSAVLHAWWPLLLGAPTALCVAVGVTAGAVPNDLSAWSLLLIDFLTVLTAALTGLACTWALPTVVAVPFAAMLWFVWIGYGPASTNLLVHNLDSTFGCCSSDTAPATAAIQATVLLLLMISCGILGLLASPQSARMPRLLVAAAVTVLAAAGFGAGIAVLLAYDEQLNLTATQPRTTPLACSTEQGLEVCLWPENRDRTAALIAEVTALNPALDRLGLDLIHSLTQANRNRDAVTVEAGPDISRDEMRVGIAVGYVDLHSGCYGAVGPARDRSVALVALLSGVRPELVAARFGTPAAAGAGAALAQDQDGPGAVGAWFGEGLRKVSCGPRR